jgi:hypothetical protein
MRRIVLLAAVAALFGIWVGVARADKPPIEFAGKPFYFGGTCTGLGDVILVNQSLARRPALRVVGSHAVVIPTYDNPHAPANGTCRLTGGGFSIGSIEPFDEPFNLDALIVP